MLAWASMGAPAEGMGWQKEGTHIPHPPHSRR
jgi:hypothetical protein